MAMKGDRVAPWVLLLVQLVSLPSLAQQAREGEAALLGSTWRLERILYNDGKEIRPGSESVYTIQFQPNGRLAGQADVNRIMGSYTVSGRLLTIGPLASTRVADPPGSIRAEFTKALEQASSFQVTGDRLRVELKVDSGTMTFVRPSIEPLPAGPDAAAVAPLVGEWSLVRMDGRELPAGGETPTIAFDADGGMSGSTGVNRYQATAELGELAEGRVALGQVATTRRAGPPEAMKRETQFLEALRKVRVWKLSGRTLFLEDGHKTLLVFRQLPRRADRAGTYRLASLQASPSHD
jgi:heat shock protein HslJ